MIITYLPKPNVAILYHSQTVCLQKGLLNMQDVCKGDGPLF